MLLALAHLMNASTSRRTIISDFEEGFPASFAQTGFEQVL